MNVVNRGKAVTTEKISNSGNFAGEALTMVINSENMHASHAYAKRKDYIPVPREIKISGKKSSYSFSTRSSTQIMANIR